MAYPDYGALMPTEALFSEPGAYAGVLKGEALKRASYLSQMDQFYAELEESTRRFEKQYTLAEKEFEFGKEESLWQRGFTEEQSEWEREYKTSALEQERYLSEQELALGRSTLRAQTSAQRESTRGDMTESEEFSAASKFLKELYGSQETPSYDFGEEDDYFSSFAGTPSATKSYADPEGDWFYGMGGEEVSSGEVPLENWIKNLTTDKTFTIS